MFETDVEKQFERKELTLLQKEKKRKKNSTKQYSLS